MADNISERIGLQEMAIASSRGDEDLNGIDIAVFSQDHPPKHAHILKRGNHRIELGRFQITQFLPKTHVSILEVKEEIDSEYKRQIAAWAGKKSLIFPGMKNWDVLKGTWDLLNPPP
jgi:hypothetical protein